MRSGIDSDVCWWLKGGMKKLTLHLGMHRCASTSTQNLLKTNHAVLSGRGIDVLLRRDMLSGKGINIRTWHRIGATDPRAWGSKRRFVSSINQMPGDHVILSEEGLVGTMPAVLSRDFYPHMDHFLARIEPLVQHFNVRLRFIVRRQDRFLTSVYAFRLMRGLTDDFETFLRSFPRQCFDWDKLTTSLDNRGLAGGTRIAVMDSWTEDDFSDQLMGLLGLEAAGLVPVGRGNRSLPARALRLLLAVNRAGVMTDLAVRKKGLIPLLRKTEAPTMDTLSNLFSPKIIAKIKPYYEPQAVVGFSEQGRQDFLANYSSMNEKFLTHATVDAQPAVWW